MYTKRTVGLTIVVSVLLLWVAGPALVGNGTVSPLQPAVAHAQAAAQAVAPTATPVDVSGRGGGVLAEEGAAPTPTAVPAAEPGGIPPVPQVLDETGHPADPIAYWLLGPATLVLALGVLLRLHARRRAR